MPKLDLIKIKNLLQDQLEFKVGEGVYHRTPGSRKGVIVDWRLHGHTGEIDYLVAFSPGEVVQMSEEEISRDYTPDLD